MAARLTTENKSGTPPLIPDREDDMESFWHVLLWIALRHCDHRMSGMKLVDTLGVLFDHKYIGDTGQLYSGGCKLASLKSRLCITDMELASKVLDTILVNTAEVLATRYLSKKDQSQIEEVQRMWENLERKSSAVDKEDLLKADLRQRIAQIDDDRLMLNYIPWKHWRQMQGDAERMDSKIGRAHV